MNIAKILSNEKYVISNLQSSTSKPLKHLIYSVNNLRKRESISGKNRKTSTFFEKFKNKKNFLSNIEKTEENAFKIAEKVDDLFTVLNTMFENKWDIYYPIQAYTSEDSLIRFENNSLSLVLQFDEMSIKTEYENEEPYKIKKFFIFIEICFNSLGELYFKNIKFNKTFFTYAEWVHGYNHSHVPRTEERKTNPEKFLTHFSLCLGNDTILNNLIGKGLLISTGNIEEEMNKEERELYYLSFFSGIISFLENESDEGGPYFRYRNLTEKIAEVHTHLKEPSANFSTYIRDNLDYTYHLFIEKLISIDYKLNLTVKNGDLKIKEDKEFNDILKYFLIEHDHFNFVVKNDKIHSEYFSEAFLDIPIEDKVKKFKISNSKEDLYLEFKGTKYFYTVAKPVNLEIVKKDYLEYFVDPSYLKEMVERINVNLNKNYKKTHGKFRD